jgi:hypothetical protein
VESTGIKFVFLFEISLILAKIAFCRKDVNLPKHLVAKKNKIYMSEFFLHSLVDMAKGEDLPDPNLPVVEKIRRMVKDENQKVPFVVKLMLGPQQYSVGRVATQLLNEVYGIARELLENSGLKDERSALRQAVSLVRFRHKL